MSVAIEANPETCEVVLLIHGTGAAADADDGQKWWQRGSNFVRYLESHFGSSISCQETVFHWSGANSERARRAAGERLLSVLSSYEKQGRRYHLIGHSHGGSV